MSDAKRIPRLASHLNDLSRAYALHGGFAIQDYRAALEIGEAFAARILELEDELESTRLKAEERNLDQAAALAKTTVELERYDGFWGYAIDHLTRCGYGDAAAVLECMALHNHSDMQPVYDDFIAKPIIKSTKIPRAEFTPEKVAEVVREHASDYHGRSMW